MNAKKAKLIRKLARISGHTKIDQHQIISHKPHRGYFCCQTKTAPSQHIYLRSGCFRKVVKDMQRYTETRGLTCKQLKSLIDQTEFDRRMEGKT